MLNTRKAGRNGLQQFHKRAMQGGGLFEASIVRLEYVLSMALSAKSAHIFQALAQWLTMVLKFHGMMIGTFLD